MDGLWLGFTKPACLFTCNAKTVLDKMQPPWPFRTMPTRLWRIRVGADPGLLQACVNSIWRMKSIQFSERRLLRIQAGGGNNNVPQTRPSTCLPLPIALRGKRSLKSTHADISMTLTFSLHRPWASTGSIPLPSARTRCRRVSKRSDGRAAGGRTECRIDAAAVSVLCGVYSWKRFERWRSTLVPRLSVTSIIARFRWHTYIDRSTGLYYR